MNNLFLVLLLVSLATLVVGVIKPSLLKVASRKKVGLYFGGAAVVFFILFGITAPQSPNTPVATTEQGATITPAAPAATQAAPEQPAQASSQPVKPVVAKPAPAPAPAPAPHVPTILLQVSGSGTKSTQTFSAPTNWTLEYTYDCTSFSGGTGNFQVFIQKAAGGYSALTPVNQLGASGSDTEYYHSGGQLYLEVNSECSWTVTVKG